MLLKHAYEIVKQPQYVEAVKMVDEAEAKEAEAEESLEEVIEDDIEKAVEEVIEELETD